MSTVYATGPFACLMPWKPSTFVAVYLDKAIGSIVYEVVHFTDAYYARVNRNFNCPPRSQWNVLQRTILDRFDSVDSARAHIESVTNCETHDISHALGQ